VINSDPLSSSGFAIMLLKPEPEFPNDFGKLNGIKNNFNGVGVFLHRSTSRNPGKWVLIFFFIFIVCNNFAQ